MRLSIPKVSLMALHLILLICFIYACRNEGNPVLLKAESLMSSHPDSSLWLLENSIESGQLSKEQNAKWCLLITQARDKNYVLHTSDSLINIAADFFTKSDNPDERMMVYYYLARVNDDLKNVKKAQEFYLKALETGNPMNYSLLARTHANVGQLYLYQKATDIAMPHLIEAEKCYRETDEYGNLSYVLRDIGRLYSLRTQYDSATLYYERALVYADSSSKISILIELANTLADIDEYVAASAYMQKAISCMVDPNDIHFINASLGKLYYKGGNTDSARYYLYKSMASPKPETRAFSYYYIYKLAKKEHRWKEYALFQERYEDLRDTLTKQKYTAETQRLQHLYNYQQAENRAALVKLDHEIVLRNNIILSLGIVVLAGAMTGYYIYNRARQKRRRKMQNELFRSFSNRQTLDCIDQISSNSQRICELEIMIGDKAINKDKDVLELEKKLLELENKRISGIIAEKKDREQKLESSDIHNLFIRGTIEKITGNDKETYMSLIDEIYPLFKIGILHLCPSISSDDLFICYLIKVNIKAVRITQIMNLSKQAISMKKKRLALAIFGENGSHQSLNNLIESL